LENVFRGVFELPSLRNTRKRDKTKSRGGADVIFVSIFDMSAFDMGLLQKHFYGGVFELSFLYTIPRNAQKRT
jgi:hypothetical protein